MSLIATAESFGEDVSESAEKVEAASAGDKSFREKKFCFLYFFWVAFSLAFGCFVYSL